MIIVEKLWTLKFVENRIQQKKGQTLQQFINSSPDVFKDKMVTEFLKNRKTSSSSEIDISALCVVIKAGKLLTCVELKSVEHQNNTVGDLIDRIRQIRNTFMHTGEAHLDESDYDDYINDFKDIERINGEANGTCTNKIEEIHDTHFDTSKVERIVVRYKTYVEIVQRIEMSAPVEERPAPVQERPAPPNCRCYHCRHSHRTDCACYFCCHSRFKNCQ